MADAGSELSVSGDVSVSAALLLVPAHTPPLATPHHQVTLDALPPLTGRDVLIWPLHRKGSLEYAHRTAQRLYDEGAHAVAVLHFTGRPEGWGPSDATDLPWSDLQVELTAHGGFSHVIRFQAQPRKVVDALPIDPGASRALENAREAQLSMASNGLPQCNEDNVIRILNHESTDTLGYHWDDFLQRAMVNDRALETGDYARLLIRLQREYCMPKLTLTRIQIALDAFIQDRHENCAQRWVMGLQTPAAPVLASLCTLGLGTPDTPYYRAVGRCFLMGMVKRVLEPGCEVKAMPVLEGPENLGKTRALQVIGGEWYGVCNEKILDKDFLQLMPGKMLLNISEMHSFSKTEVARMKSIISTPRDRYRPTHGRAADVKDFARMCVFAGDTNRNDYNTSDTGACRLWPVQCGVINEAWLREHRDALFAEARDAVLRKECWYDVPEADQKRMVSERYIHDPWAAYIVPWLQHRTHATPAQILAECLDIPKERQDMRQEGRVRSVLQVAGWISTPVYEAGKTFRAWTPPRIPKDEPEPVVQSEVVPVPPGW